ncbi:MAG TPA: UDP-2,3-diacylglucosamine diphosphatase [Longimicrobiales bacterium]|nr:UDP-2,3-diacylglucosamine diphosphatase [Longimicrobiales bacterium]
MRAPCGRACGGDRSAGSFAAMKTDYILSDVHLGAVPDATERRLVSFLDEIGAQAASVLIAGDLFDFWFEYGEVIPGRHFRALAALSRLVDAGVPVVMAGGNHDAWGGRFLREHVGVVFHTEPFRMTLGGAPALVAHGDGLGKGDLKYRALKAVLRSRVAIGAFRALHPELGLRLARAVSSTEEKSDDDLAAAGRAAFLENWALEQLAHDASLRYVVCGHSHLPVLLEPEPGRYYLNAGDWISHFSYITVAAGRAQLHRQPR